MINCKIVIFEIYENDNRKKDYAYGSSHERISAELFYSTSRNEDL